MPAGRGGTVRGRSRDRRDTTAANCRTASSERLGGNLEDLDSRIRGNGAARGADPKLAAARQRPGVGRRSSAIPAGRPGDRTSRIRASSRDRPARPPRAPVGGRAVRTRAPTREARSTPGSPGPAPAGAAGARQTPTRRRPPSPTATPIAGRRTSTGTVPAAPCSSSARRQVRPRSDEADPGRHEIDTKKGKISRPAVLKAGGKPRRRRSTTASSSSSSARTTTSRLSETLCACEGQGRTPRPPRSLRPASCGRRVRLLPHPRPDTAPPPSAAPRGSSRTRALERSRA